MCTKIRARDLLIVLFVCATIFGCGGNKVKRENGFNNFTQQERYFVKRGMKFAWGERTFFDAPRFSDSDIEQQLDAAIVDGLILKGLKPAQYSEDSQFLVYYTVVLGEVSHEKASEQRPVAELSEVEGAAINSIEYGKILLVLRETETGRLIWQEGVSGFTGLDMQDEERKQRLLRLVEILLDDLPLAAN